MPQCSKCGREISDYGLCSRCARDAKRYAHLKNISQSKPRCPSCNSVYCERISRTELRCCMCDCEFEEE